MKNVSPASISVPDVVGMKPAAPIDYSEINGPGRRNDDGKAEAYRNACQTACELAAARKKCREAIDLALKASTEDAARFARAMIEVGAAASWDFGDGPSTAFLLGHLSRRVREGSYFDF